MENNTVLIDMTGSGCISPSGREKEPGFHHPDQAALLDKLLGLCPEPVDVDERAASLGLLPVTVNPYFASALDYGWSGVIEDGCVRLPVPFTGKYGRSSVFWLRPGESTQDALLIARKGIFYSVITRMTGNTDRAEAGNYFEFSVRDGAGRILAKSTAKLVHLEDHEDGVFGVPAISGRQIYVYECRRKSKKLILKYITEDDTFYS